jgi:hypothetical protein
MNPQMDVLYVPDLGHVLAAFTRAAEPDQIETSVAAFVGDGLHLRGLPGAKIDDDFLVPAAQIALLRTSFDALPLRMPRNYCVQSGNPPALVPVAGTFGAPVVAATSVTISAAPGQFAAGTKVQTLVTGPPLGNPLLITLPPSPAPGPTIDIAIPALTSGPYYAIVFVPLYPITAIPFSVP